MNMQCTYENEYTQDVFMQNNITQNLRNGQINQLAGREG